jgi:hypothetical protein
MNRWRSLEDHLGCAICSIEEVKKVKSTWTPLIARGSCTVYIVCLIGHTQQVIIIVIYMHTDIAPAPVLGDLHNCTFYDTAPTSPKSGMANAVHVSYIACCTTENPT